MVVIINVQAGIVERVGAEKQVNDTAAIDVCAVRLKGMLAVG